LARPGHETQVLAGRQRESFRRTGFDVDYELPGVPGRVLPGVHVERAAGDAAEQQVARPGEVLPVGEAHQGAAGAAPGGLDEHQRAADGPEADNRLPGRLGRDGALSGDAAAAARRQLTAPAPRLLTTGHRELPSAGPAGGRPGPARPVNLEA